ncbi:type II secretion system protein N [Luteimonas huabeiensis]|uniref:type II secretion system protein N n=1 Tax=Luteimonas huabeiensis TaxID=1244513 RepID=UPI00046619CC|nr:type II secretion system protein N [Luteimonas huabeiensis]
MSARRLGLVFVLALAAMLAAFLPLRLALDLAGATRAGLAAANVSGSVWRGRIAGATLHGIALGDLDVGLAPLPLLIGRRELRLGDEEVRLRLRAGEVRGLQQADGRLRMPAGAHGIGLELRAQALRLLFDRDACRAAAGTLALALHRPGSDDAFATLAGSPACDGRDARIPLQGGDGPIPGLQGELRLHADGQWELDARVPGAIEPGMRLVLEAAGFRPGPGGWSTTLRGALAPLPPPS